MKKSHGKKFIPRFDLYMIIFPDLKLRDYLSVTEILLLSDKITGNYPLYEHSYMNKYTTLSIRILLNTQCDFLPINLTPIVIAEYIKYDILA